MLVLKNTSNWWYPITFGLDVDTRAMRVSLPLTKKTPRGMESVRYFVHQIEIKL